jgi:hypothetical protein
MLRVPGNKPASALDRLKKLSVNERLDEMQENIKNSLYVFPKMALEGQMTAFIAKPNSGKTLFFLHQIIQGIKEGRLDPGKVFYINADDNYKGLYEKGRYAEQYGFYMLSPQEAGVKTHDVITLLLDIAMTDDVCGLVVILDTLKKFVDVMNKADQRDFYDALRTITTKGGTVIIAGHANKHLSADGKLVFQGTQDLEDDIDCLYYIYRLTEKDESDQLIEFRIEKDRGVMTPKAAFTFKKDEETTYDEMLNSFTAADDDAVDRKKQDQMKKELLEKYEDEVSFIHSVLSRYLELNQTEIIQHWRDKTTPEAELITGKDKLRTALKSLIGIAWTEHPNPGRDNAKYYRIKR